MNTSASSQPSEIERARYKLRQAEMALGYLRDVPAQIAKEMRNARAIALPDLRLDTFFFACLGLAKSAYYIIKDDRSKDAIHSWRMNVLKTDKERAQFNRMMNLRDIDVHQGKSDGETLAKMIPLQRSGDGDAWIYQPRQNYAVFGIRPVPTEHRNADGNVASSFDGLQGSMSLYVNIAGEICEAETACERFIAQLNGLVDAVQSANIPPLTRLQRFRRWCKSKFPRRD